MDAGLFLLHIIHKLGIIFSCMQRNKFAMCVKEATMSDMINEEEKIGKISIADGVVASIAGIAAIEVEGV